MKKQIEEGFTLWIILIVVVVLGLIGWIGYNFFTTANRQVNQPVEQTQVVAPVGTTGSIDNLTTQDALSEASIDASYVSKDQTSDQDSNTAANNLEGAYDESSF